MNKKNLFHYNSKILKVSELAAIAVYDFIGKKDENAADKAAVEAMRTELNKLDFSGTIVIGEGERDKAPMLYIGEKVGNGKSGLNFDIALDPLEGTKITANNEKNALTVISLGNKGSFLNAPDVYMEKIAVGPDLPNGVIDLDKSIKKNIEDLADAKNKKPNDLIACVLNRPRHNKIVQVLNEMSVNIQYITDGDVSGVISVALKSSNIDIYLGTGGAPEGVLAASALSCLNGQMQGRLIFEDQKQILRAKKLGIVDLKKKYNIENMVKGDVIFCATGVTDGDLVAGIKDRGDSFSSETLTLHKSSNTNRIVKKLSKK